MLDRGKFSVGSPKSVKIVGNLMIDDLFALTVLATIGFAQTLKICFINTKRMCFVTRLLYASDAHAEYERNT